MALYLGSLRRMASAAATALAPAHGGVLRPPGIVLERYVEHRLAREQKVLDALARAGREVSAGELVPDAYADTARAAWPLAALSTEAHLIKLELDRRARRTASGRWIALAP
jgi:ribonuclease/clavin/mitogillin